jgi:hypothetical protein
VRITVLGYWSIGFLTFDIVTDQEVDHLPDPSTLPGTLDLIAFCFLVILGNVFDFRTYTNAIGDPLEEVDVHDQNGIALEERVNICQARGVCLELLRWWESKYRATNPAATGSSACGFHNSSYCCSSCYSVKVQKICREGQSGRGTRVHGILVVPSDR